MKINELKAVIKNSEYDAVLLTGLENPVAANNLKYITEYTGSFGFAIIGEEYQYFVSDFRYRDQVQLEVPTFTFIEIDGNLSDTLESIVSKEKIKILGFDKKIRYEEYQMYSSLSAELIPLDGVIETLRISKNETEIAKLQKACEITDQALEYTLSKIKVGMTEREVEVLLKNKMIELGADKTWDRFIVASGYRGAMPHGSASDKIIDDGDFVTFDIGCFYQGYSSDLTRTVCMGKPGKDMEDIYNTVYEAQKLAVKAAKAGITGKELDSISRNYITEAGYGEFFKHGLGHGLGLDIHEAPRLNQKNDQPLELGACITIEPGIYVSGLGGVRIEDDVILTVDGCIVLNKFPKELIIIK
jgi:Xaa-Pro aminopeptidase